MLFLLMHHLCYQIEEEEALDITVGKEEDVAETAADKPASLGKRRSTDSAAGQES